ncbi:MAG: hypothetical protein C0617_14145 [Desulfuromonas sp.]|nr:MAG: hypothetical protein C0617_14145 [Desulfuromonas sp.]
MVDAMKKYFPIALLAALVVFAPAVHGAGGDSPSATVHMQRGRLQVRQGRLFEGLQEYRHVARKGQSNSRLHRDMALTLYQLGLLGEATAEMEKAAGLSEKPEEFDLGLGVLYLAGGRMEESKERLSAALFRDPALAVAYYYLGELYLKAEEPGMAWFAAQRARNLGLQSEELLRRLELRGPAPRERDAAADDLCLRQAFTAERKKAEALQRRMATDISWGGLLSLRRASAPDFPGSCRPDDLPAPVETALAGLEPFSSPVTVETERGFYVVQRLLPYSEENWRAQLAGRTAVVVRALERVETPLPPSPPEPTPEKSKAKIQEEALAQVAAQVKKQAAAKAGRRVSLPLSESVPARRQAEGRFVLHAGCFKNDERAYSLVAKLKSLGLSSFTKEIPRKDGGVLLGVVADLYPSLAEAEKAKELLRGKNLDSFISPK